MGFKRLFSRVIRKLKNAECTKVDSTTTSYADATDMPQPIFTALETSDPAIHLDITPPVIVGPDPTSMQVILWQPPVFPVPPFVSTPRIVSSHRRLPLVHTAAALALGCPPTVAAQPLIGLYSLLRYSNRLEHDLMLQMLQQAARVTTTVCSMEVGGPTPDEESSSSTPEIRYLVADLTLAHLAPMQKVPPGAYGPRHQLPPPKVSVNPQVCPRSGEGSLRCPETRFLAAFASRQAVLGGTFEAHQAIGPAVGMPSLAWSSKKTAGTLEISTPKFPSPDLGALSKKVPRYPPGLGYPEDDVGTAEVAHVPTSILQPTLPCRPNLLNAELVPTEYLASATAVHSADLRQEVAQTQDGASPDAGKARFEKYMVQTSVVRMKAGMYRYKFTRPIGSGANGTVWFGEGTRDDGPAMDVAAKVINRQAFFSTFVSDKDLAQMSSAKGKRCLDEKAVYAGNCIHSEFDAWLAATYECHPFLTPLIDCFSDDKNIYFIMRYYPENLRLRASNKACSFQLWQIRLIAAEMALGLERLHDVRIMHNDLKPENILVTPNGHVTVCDFGHATTFSPDVTEDQWNGKTMSGKAGTDGYLAPEQFAGDSTHNYKADIYAFGLIILDLFMPSGSPWYEYVPGLDLADDDDIEKSLFEHGQPDPRQASVMGKVYDHLAKDLLMQILHPNPARRPAWNEIKKHPFFTNYLDWARVLARDYDPCYRACSRRQKVKPIIRPSCWIRQRRHTRAANAIHTLLQRNPDKDSIGTLNIQAPRGLGWIDKRHGVACSIGRDRCVCDFPLM
ncbi:kinase-like domain-containing protein [Pisolithus thermaeus]|nr:kinase-like domain-containing protein [Pisolithus thermaeus]